jgi:replicative DNA helicase
MIADACYIACDKIYDPTFGSWISNGKKQPVVYITTEQEKDEIQTMMLAFLACVDEDHILNGKYEEGEEERVFEAAKVLKDTDLYLEELPDFSLQDVEDTIKKHIRDHDVKYVCFDYIHTSLKILEEITRKTGGVKLREDNILFMLSIRLKDLCNKYGIFILSSTQLNCDYVNSDTPDQNLLRGAKAIADKIDWGGILLPVTDSDLKSLNSILENSSFDKPNIKLSVYKNRRGRYKGIILWCRGNLGTCRVDPIFATNYAYELLSLKDMRIQTEEESAF